MLAKWPHRDNGVSLAGRGSPQGPGLHYASLGTRKIRGRKRVILPPMALDTTYRGRTMDWLLLSNAARFTPLPDRDLCAYNNHNYASLRVRKTFLKRAGAINKDGSLNWTHQMVQNAIPPIEELQPLLIQPSALKEAAASPKPKLHQKVVQNLALKTNQGDAAISEAFGDMTIQRAVSILTEWVDSGAAGRDTPKFIAQIVDLNDKLSGGVGPPPPSSPSAAASRLARIFDSVPRSTILLALRQHRDLLRTRKAPPRPPETSGGPPDEGPTPSGPSGPGPSNDLPEPDPRGTLGDPSS